MKMINKTIDDKRKLKGRRILAIDFGQKRVGLAVCDEMHITTRPLVTLIFDSPDFWEKLLDNIISENASAIVIGYPYRNDNKKTELQAVLDKFIDDIEKKINIEIYIHDESHSSQKALNTMLEIGMKQKNRRKKDNLDKFAAAIILREFLEEIRII